MTSNLSILHSMCYRMKEVLEELRDIQDAYNLIEEYRTHRILHSDMVLLEHIVNQLREMRRNWNKVLDQLECEELKKWQEASLRDAGEKEKEEVSGNDE